jgi:hypothetical protein
VRSVPCAVPRRGLVAAPVDVEVEAVAAIWTRRAGIQGFQLDGDVVRNGRRSGLPRGDDTAVGVGTLQGSTSAIWRRISALLPSRSCRAAQAVPEPQGIHRPRPWTATGAKAWRKSGSLLGFFPVLDLKC